VEPSNHDRSDDDDSGEYSENNQNETHYPIMARSAQVHRHAAHRLAYSQNLRKTCHGARSGTVAGGR
ncbi:hypothetical protein, partial [uncultured Ilumatobacter sp.]|uniref:hypothetical protein n=1 Tax=uncultured Ilumatobacter sp. TaxID=879968 RepID=UPI00374E41A2